MNDLISRKVAIAYAVSGLTRQFEGEKWIRVSEVRESIQTMPAAQQEQRWIPTSERLPEEQKSYWVCTDTGYQCQCRFTDNVYGLGTGALGWKIHDLPRFQRVVAWMPLPEAYKPEGAEE